MATNQIRIFPTEEKYIPYVKADPDPSVGELIINPKSGDLTIVDNVETEEGVSIVFKSATKDYEAKLDNFLILKEELFRDYIKVSDDLEETVMRLTNGRNTYIDTRAVLNDLENKILFINSRTQQLLEEYNSSYRTYNKFLFNDIKNFKTILTDNTIKLINIEFILKEINFLCDDLIAIQTINEEQLNAINLQ